MIKQSIKYLIFFSLFFSLVSSGQADILHIKVYDDVGGDFTLTDQHGKSFVMSEQNEKLTLLFFGYLNCPDICPMTLSEMMEVKSLLGANKNQVQFAMVTLDPERDTQEQLRLYMMNFDPEFLGLYGDRKTTDEIAKRYHVLHKKRILRSGLGYSVDHSGGAYLVDKKGRLRYIFPSKSPASRFVQGIEMILEGKASEEIRKPTWLEKLVR
ncbi:MAG: SCO family protein [SAR324 cluster bacterium]|nr:SCO family protein [SAR324 cluster bacterium]